MEKEVKVVFEPSGRSVHVLPGTVMIEAAARAGFIIQTPCGGAGKCGKCLVRVSAGKCPPLESEQVVLGEVRVAEGFRLACQAKIQSPLTVVIPETSLFQAQQQILTTDTGEKLEVRPRVRKCYLELAPPTHSDPESDLERLRRGVGHCSTRVSAVRAIPRTLRETGFRSRHPP